MGREGRSYKYNEEIYDRKRNVHDTTLPSSSDSEIASKYSRKRKRREGHKENNYHKNKVIPDYESQEGSDEQLALALSESSSLSSSNRRRKEREAKEKRKKKKKKRKERGLLNYLLIQMLC